MMTIILEDDYYRRTMAWLRSLADTLPIDQKMELQAFVEEMAASVSASATVFDGSAFETFLERLHLHPKPHQMMDLLDKARVRCGDQTPF